MLKIGQIKYKRETLILRAGYYGHGNVAIVVNDAQGQPYANLSTNVVTEIMAPGEFVVTHNLDHMQGLLKAFLDSGLFVYTGRTVDYGHVVGQPVWRWIGFAEAADQERS